jgi:hypothetical protein
VIQLSTVNKKIVRSTFEVSTDRVQNTEAAEPAQLTRQVILQHPRNIGRLFLYFVVHTFIYTYSRTEITGLR